MNEQEELSPLLPTGSQLSSVFIKHSFSNSKSFAYCCSSKGCHDVVPYNETFSFLCSWSLAYS